MEGSSQRGYRIPAHWRGCVWPVCDRPRQGIRIIRAPTYGGPSLYFNNDTAPFDKKEVRQAIAYSIKRDENGKVSLGDSGVNHKYMIGLSDNLVDQWIEKDALTKMNIYEYDLGKAEKALETASFMFANNYLESTTGKGMNFPMKQKVGDKEIDLQALIVDAAVGLDESKQKANITAVAAVFNDLLPIVPLWERYGNNPALDKRVTGYPADGDPIYKNAVYGDNFVVMMILDGTLKPKA